MTDVAAMTSRQAPWLHVVPEERDTSVAVAHVESEGGRVVALDGAKMRDVEGLFREYVREFRFPEYFGWNWDAFYECLRELEALPARSYLTVVSHAEEVLRKSASDLLIYLDILKETSKWWADSFALSSEWGGGEVPFNTIFLCPPGALANFRSTV